MRSVIRIRRGELEGLLVPADGLKLSVADAGAERGVRPDKTGKGGG